MKTFQQDDDGHWYLIDVDDLADFLSLLNSNDEDEYFNSVFFEHRCEHPSNYCFDHLWGL